MSNKSFSMGRSDGFYISFLLDGSAILYDVITSKLPITCIPLILVIDSLFYHAVVSWLSSLHSIGLHKIHILTYHICMYAYMFSLICYHVICQLHRDILHFAPSHLMWLRGFLDTGVAVIVDYKIYVKTFFSSWISYGKHQKSIQGDNQRHQGKKRVLQARLGQRTLLRISVCSLFWYFWYHFMLLWWRYFPFWFIFQFLFLSGY